MKHFLRKVFFANMNDSLKPNATTIVLATLMETLNDVIDKINSLQEQVEDVCARIIDLERAKQEEKNK